MEQLRSIWTDHGQIIYVLTRKKIKNLNLRISAEGEVSLSVPLRCTNAQADAFVSAKSGWITVRLAELAQREELLPELDRRECYTLLKQALDRVYPLIEDHGVERPALKIRRMRSQWGNCHWMQGYITLNTALHRCPEYLRDYVALHELVHFLHHDHGPGFYAVMDILMPDWKQRRKELKRFSWALGK